MNLDEETVGPGATDPDPTDQVALAPAGRQAAGEVDAVLEMEDGETTLFETAINAFHAGEFQRAESLFLEEAERALDLAPQRAAIAFRQAALAARQGGNIDASDHWMRLAGREYLRVSEDIRTPLPFIREAAVMAAKCFLSVENLSVATKGLRRAQAIESVLRADEDLMAPGNRSTGGDSDRPDDSTAAAPEFTLMGGDGSVGEPRIRERRSPWRRRIRSRLPTDDVA
ncbi:MAG TPA: hypothetical protein VMV06_01165 [Acidimicrobiales bacterium]|nr:hypothetical protein [Acidimicrobiales bacterium]